ncbi:AlkZ family DNA glycosylase [Nocardioides sp. Y6]|uniref:AlkZ family DNA glycosylase n=1 Tax=Nocardioides malaquae TaxID=2773426 RepID=A0ABR9RUC3_9ACTN|nr:winged helix DNA-binding domain-containing protein [Nocardioides malaquae]MBE7324735.1 AlkZ family DNA glycosylase [Nocardioides malaquae]
MPDAALARQRLVAQGLITRPWATPADAVRAFGAMQGQDLPGAIASAALRTPERSAAAVVEDLDAGRLVRGYPMRGTVFLMAAEDVTWVTELCAGPAARAAQQRRSQLGLDESDVDRARALAHEVLADGPASRATLFARWDEAGPGSDAGKGYHLLSALIHETTLCYGPWNGKDQDVVLAERWLPEGRTLEARFNSDRVAAVAELLRRYLTTHGPATVRDFSWWAKLPMKEIRAALALVADDLESDAATTDGEARYWRPGLLDEVAAVGRASAAPLLLPGFDEFVLGYGDRLFAMSQSEHEALVPGNNGVFKKSVVRGGRVVGTWTRTGSAGRRKLVLTEFAPHSPRQLATLERLFAEHPWVNP